MHSSAQGKAIACKNKAGPILLIAAVLIIAVGFVALGRRTGREYAWFLFTTQWPVAQEVRLSVAQGSIQPGTDIVEITITNNTPRDIYFLCENLNLQKQGEAGTWLHWHKKKNTGDPETSRIEHVLKPGAIDILKVPFVNLLPEKLQEAGTYRLHLPIRFYNSSTDEWVDSYTVLLIEIGEYGISHTYAA